MAQKWQSQEKQAEDGVDEAEEDWADALGGWCSRV
jgi:hypothetical protein